MSALHQTHRSIASLDGSGRGIHIQDNTVCRKGGRPASKGGGVSGCLDGSSPGIVRASVSTGERPSVGRTRAEKEGGMLPLADHAVHPVVCACA
eukprot:3185111-Rhodomonas_salina.2